MMIEPTFELSDGAGGWVDISHRVRIGPGVSVDRGRDGDGLTITPGEATLTLENLPAEGETGAPFDPVNEDGPYFGLLAEFAPFRLRHGAYNIFTGYVRGWPQVTESSDALVEIEVTDVFGRLATVAAPQSAWDAAIDTLAEPDEWWRPGAEGWVDAVSARSGVHTSSLVPLDPVVDGGEESWGQDGDGIGIVPPASWTMGVSDYTVASFIIRHDPEQPIPPTTTVLHQGNGAAIRFEVTIDTDANGSDIFRVTLTDSSGAGSRHQHLFVMVDGTFGYRMNLRDGRAHHVLVCAETVSGFLDECLVFVDGALTPPLVGLPTTEPVTTSGDLRFGMPGKTWIGALDHVLIWRDIPTPVGGWAEWATTLTEAMRLAWTGDRLDQRAARIVEACGFGDTLGALDESAITTGHGYRSDDPLVLLQRVEDTEQGRIWCDRDGQVRFAARGWSWTDTVSTVPQARFTTEPDELGDPNTWGHLDDGFKASLDPSLVTNVAEVTSEYGRMQPATDRVSVAAKGRLNPIHLSGLLHASDRQSKAIAEWILLSRGTPVERVHQLRFHAGESDELADFAAQVEEGWLIEVEHFGKEYSAHVQTIAHEFDDEGWWVTLTLDSTRTARQWFRADTSTTDGPDVAAF